MWELLDDSATSMHLWRCGLGLGAPGKIIIINTQLKWIYEHTFKMVSMRWWDRSNASFTSCLTVVGLGMKHEGRPAIMSLWKWRSLTMAKGRLLSAHQRAIWVLKDKFRHKHKENIGWRRSCLPAFRVCVSTMGKLHRFLTDTSKTCKDGMVLTIFPSFFESAIHDILAMALDSMCLEVWGSSLVLCGLIVLHTTVQLTLACSTSEVMVFAALVIITNGDLRFEKPIDQGMPGGFELLWEHRLVIKIYKNVERAYQVLLHHPLRPHLGYPALRDST